MDWRSSLCCRRRSWRRRLYVEDGAVGAGGNAAPLQASSTYSAFGLVTRSSARCLSASRSWFRLSFSALAEFSREGSAILARISAENCCILSLSACSCAGSGGSPGTPGRTCAGVRQCVLIFGQHFHSFIQRLTLSSNALTLSSKALILSSNAFSRASNPFSVGQVLVQRLNLVFGRSKYCERDDHRKDRNFFHIRRKPGRWLIRRTKWKASS